MASKLLFKISKVLTAQHAKANEANIHTALPMSQEVCAEADPIITHISHLRKLRHRGLVSKVPERVSGSQVQTQNSRF